MGRMQRIAIRILAAALAIPLLAGLAYAHTRLQGADPAPDATVEEPPGRIRIWFNQPVDVLPDAIVVTGPDGARIDADDAALDPEDRRAIVATLRATQAGVYTVQWRVLSTDGHPVSGSYRFEVANPAPPPMEDTAADLHATTAVASTDAPAPPAARAGHLSSPPGAIGLRVARGLHLLALIAALGPLVFVLAVLGPRSTPGINARALRIGRLGAWLLPVAALVMLVAQAAALAGSAAGGLGGEMLGAVLETQWGKLWLARLVAALILIGILDRAVAVADRPFGSLRPAAAAGLLVGLALVVLTSLNGHAAAAEKPWVAVAGDAIHLLAAVAWLGGLLALRFGLYPALGDRAPHERRAVLADAVPRFSTLALTCVLALVATGLYQAYAYLGDAAAPLRSPYGATLAGKLALVALVMIPAAVNLLVVRPRLASGTSRDAGDAAAENAVQTLRRLVTLEAAIGLLIVAVVAVLTTLPPPG
ncbi:MAG TPA: copper resistance protein CopC [Longimicrobiales bacterium]|nr:copper resistance protein CopC [Longimicrobiales bacterium]